MPDATITSTASTFGTITGTFAADQSTVTGTITGIITGTLSGSVGVPGPQGQQGIQGPPGPVGPAGPGSTWGTITGTLSSQTDLQTALNLKADLASPVFTGDPQAPTPVFGDNDTSIATTAFVQAGLLGGTANARNLEVYVRNQSGSTIPAGSIVYISGATGNRPLITLAQANNDANSAQTMGFTKTAIADNGFGYVIVRGELENIDTSALTEGVQLYLSPTTAGTWTTTKPSAPQHLVYVGIVVRAHPTQGIILVAVQNGYEMDELHDVKITGVSNGQVLKYDSAQGLWVNATDLNSGVWGSITGTLSSQTDLQSALDAKQNVSAMSAYLTKADNLASVASTSTARSNLGLGSLDTPTFAGVNVPGSGTSVANLGATSLTINQQGSGQFTIQPSQGIVFPNGTTQVTAYPGPPGATTWGSITGTLSSQTDLQTALNAKYDASNPSGFITASALTGYATESWVTAGFYPLTGNPSGFLTSSALTPYLTIASASATYQTIAGMSSYLTTSAAASTYQTIAGMSSYLTTTAAAAIYQTQAAMAGYATESWVTSQGYITSVGFYPLTQDLGYDTSSNDGRLLIDGVFDPTASGFSSSRLNFGSTTPSSPLNGDLWTNGTTFRYTLGGTTYDIASESYVTTRGYITSSALSSYAPLASPALSGVPTAPTASLGTNTTQIATTAFVLANAPAAPVTSVAGRTGAVVLAVADVSGAAPLASPTFTGTPSLPTGTTAVTQTPGNNTTALATTAFVTAAIPAFGATSDIKEPVSTTKAASIDNVREMLLSPAFQLFYFGAGNTGTSGTGAAVNNNGGRWKEYVTPNSAIAGHAKGVFDSTSSGIGFAGYKRGANLTSRDWSKKVWMAGRCMIGHFSLTTYNGSANTFARISLGGYTAIGAGDMSSANRGIGWKLQGGGSSALELQVSNGSTVTTVTSSFTPTLKQVFDWEIYSDGAGNVTLYVNDSQVATTTAGPTGTQTSGLYMEGVDSTASSTAAFILNNLGTKIYYGI